MSTQRTDDFVARVKRAVNILDVVGEQVVLRKQGGNHTGLCPFHGEKTPSFSVSESKQLYHCYGCKASGDLVTFVMELHGLSFREAILDLAERAGIPLTEKWAASKEGDGATDARARQAYKLNLFVTQFYKQELSKHPRVRTYVQGRGVTPEAERLYQVGYAPEGWEALAKYLIQAKAPLDQAEALGLIRKSQKGGGSTPFFDQFRDRVIFPIIDARGRVQGFGGRTFGSVAEGEGGPKFLNSSDSLIYQKSKSLFGLFQARKEIREKDEVLIVEGYFDVIALAAAGIQNVVATCGTAMTEDHFGLLKRFASRIVILYDGDKAGRAANDRVMETGLKLGIPVYGVFLPEGQDPDNVVLEGPAGVEKLKKWIEEARPLIDVRIDEAVAYAAKGAEERVQACKRVGAWLGGFPDPIGREVRLEDFSKRVGVTREALGLPALRTQASTAPRPSPKPSRPPMRGSTSLKPLTRADLALLQAWARPDAYASEFRWVESELPPGIVSSAVFESAELRALAEEAGAGFPNGIPEDAPGSVRETIVAALMGEAKLPSAEDLRGATRTAMGRIWARFSQDLKKALHDAEARNDFENRDRLMKEFLDVQRKIREFTRPL